MPILKVNNINSYSGNTLNLGASTDAITLTATSLTVPSTASISLPNNSLSYANIANPVNFRNRIINGDMRIDQRNSGGSITPTTEQYVLDRWLAGMSTGSKYSVKQNAGSIVPPIGFSNYLGVTSLSSYSLGASDEFNIQQRIEGYNFADLGFGTVNAKTITLSFWVLSSLTGTFGGEIYGSPNRTYPFTYNISTANTWTYITIVVPGDTTVNTYNTTNGFSIIIVFGLGSGSSTSGGTINTWQNGNYTQPSGTVSVVSTNGATWYITGVQLEAGSNASGFEFLPIDVELARCLRYYEVGGFFNVSYGSGSNIGSTIKYAVVKRAAPTFTQTSTSNYNCSATPSAASTGNNTESILSYRTGASGASQYSETWTASAEL